MTDEEKFHLLTQPFGRHNINRLDIYDRLKSRYTAFLNKYSTDPQLEKKFPNIIVDFRQTYEFNAFAKKVQDQYLIGFNHVVFTIIHNVFSLILSNPNLLKDVGNPEEEVEKEEKFNLLIYLENLKSYDDFDRIVDIIPKNNIRKIYAGHLTLLAMDFLFDHEFSHILFGHLDWLSKKQKLDMYSEFHSSVEGLSLFDLQTLEMDADSTATARSCARIVEIVNGYGFLPGPDLSFIYKDYYTAFSTLCYSISILLMLFGDEDVKNTQAGKSTHPASRIRLHFVIGIIDEASKAFKLDLKSEELTIKCLDKMMEAR